MIFIYSLEIFVQKEKQHISSNIFLIFFVDIFLLIIKQTLNRKKYEKR